MGHGTATAGLVVITWGAESAVYSSPATGCLEELKLEKLLKLELPTSNLQRNACASPYACAQTYLRDSANTDDKTLIGVHKMRESDGNKHHAERLRGHPE